MAQGFIINDADVTGITTSYAIGDLIKLYEDTAQDPKSRALPQSCFIEDLELVVDVTAGSPTSINGYLTWDATGDDVMAGEFTMTPVTGLTDTSLKLGTVELRGTRTAPTGQSSAGACYLWLKTDAGTVTLKKARLHWTDKR